MWVSWRNLLILFLIVARERWARDIEWRAANKNQTEGTGLGMGSRYAAERSGTRMSMACRAWLGGTSSTAGTTDTGGNDGGLYAGKVLSEHV